MQFLYLGGGGGGVEVTALKFEIKVQAQQGILVQENIKPI